MGAVGVGGVVIVPSMIAVIHIDPKVAVASTIVAFILISLSGLYTYREILSRHALRSELVALGAAAGGVTAAFALRSITSQALSIGIAVFCIGFGTKCFVQICHSFKPPPEIPSHELSSQVSPLQTETMNVQQTASRGPVNGSAVELSSFSTETKSSLPSLSNEPRSCHVVNIESVRNLEDGSIVSDCQLKGEVGMSPRSFEYLGGNRHTEASNESTGPCSESHLTSQIPVPLIHEQSLAAPVVSLTTTKTPTSPKTSSRDKDNDGSKEVSDPIENAKYFGLGTIVGFGSALTGTSGPLLLIPTILLWKPKTPTIEAIALSFAVGVPMAVTMTSTSVFVAGQTVDIGLSLLVGVVTGVCLPLGRVGARRLEKKWGTEKVNRLLLGTVAAVLVATGSYIVVEALLTMA